ncbi:Crp/Fnr family transcriptional regulator [Aquabacterium sp. A7-Y]|uniref:Crp/Fnr family transcriptional regulator n=1 Tax=Aquabacterium sp. A7-Y TaxID=1349605 RepID=UPI00223CE96F|nr:Crp/Fnr family transcriptional regulator [Aquabacterium sp. A7-Y]MCW7541675.1 Crp/Fnr family transcriptional regulator [Aquabacterium sp. A7-Y]
MLRNSGWGRNLTPAEFDRVASDVREIRVPAGGYIGRTGEPAEHWIGIIEGLAKMSVTSPEGRTATLAGVVAGGWFGEGSLLKKELRRYDIIAIRDTRVALLPRASFEWLRGTSLPFNHYLLNLLNARLGLFIGLLEYDRLLGPDARLARCLASLFNPDLYPEPGPYVDLLQVEVGLLSGVSRQRANVALQRLQQAGLIRIEHRGLTVLDLEGLRRFAGGG